MVKRVSLIICIIFVLVLISTYALSVEMFDVYNSESIYRITTAQDALFYANKDIKDLYGINISHNYFGLINADKRPIRYDLINSSLSNIKRDGSNTYFDNLYLVYGNEHGNVVNSQSQYLGYTIEGHNFENPRYPWGNWDGTPIDDWWLIKEPWNKDDLRLEPFKVGSNIFNGTNPVFKSYPNAKIDNLELNIQKGLDLKYGSLKGYDKGVTNSNRNNPIFNRGSLPKDPDSPTGRGKWCDFVQIIQPPTYFSWGTGWIFMGTSGSYTYATVPIAPFCLLADSPNYSITVLRTGTEDNMGCVADKAKTCQAIVECRIDDYELNSQLKPRVEISVNGTRIIDEEATFTESYLVNLKNEYLSREAAYQESHKLSLPGLDASTQNWLSSVTRAKDYRAGAHELWKSSDGVWFKINPNTGSSPKRVAKRYFLFSWKPEQNQNEASISCRISPHAPDADPSDDTDLVKIPVLALSKPTGYVLDYDENSREFEFKLNSGNDISASLPLSPPLPSGCHPFSQWSSPTGSTGGEGGALRIAYHGDDFIASNKSVTGNSPVDGSDSSVTRKPVISWTTFRASYNDDPVNRKYYPGSANIPTDLLKSFIASTSGNFLFRQYTCGFCTNCAEDPMKGHVCGPKSSFRDIASDSFSPSVHQPLSITARVYNGMPLAVRSFASKSENMGSIARKRLEWGSRPIEINVHRWMKNVDKDGKTKGNILEAPGRFKRVFRELNTAEITYKQLNPFNHSETTASIKDWFAADINNAKGFLTGSKYYPHAPFASDRLLLNKYSYPLKAGYYCNPGGMYSITVSTVVYKSGNGFSEEHRKLVDKLAETFRHKSSLQYSHRKDGSDTYFLSYPDNNNASIAIQVPQNPQAKTAEYLPYSTDGNGVTHKFYRQVLEGWPESGTQASLDKYKYREYVDRSGGYDANIYEVRETSTIIFNVNKDNLKKYTSVKMPDGNYWMKSWFDGFSFNGLDYSYGGSQYFNPVAVSGAGSESSPYDNIDIRVQGSMYDDLGNDEE